MFSKFNIIVSSFIYSDFIIISDNKYYIWHNYNTYLNSKWTKQKYSMHYNTDYKQNIRYRTIRWESCLHDEKKNQRANKKHVYLTNKRFEYIKSSSSVLFLETKRPIGTYQCLHWKIGSKLLKSLRTSKTKQKVNRNMSSRSQNRKDQWWG